MAFAIFYNREDLTPIAAELTRQDLSNNDRRFAQAIWQGGASGWNTAPLAPREYQCVQTPEGERCDDDIRILVIDAQVQGQPVTLQQTRDFLYRQSSLPGGIYLAGLADDMGRTAVEPWPIV